MAIERRSPLPVGRYWIDVATSKAADFDGFLASNGASVHVETTEAGEPLWYLFRVLKPITWFAVNFGYPTIAGPTIKGRADTVGRPDIPKDGSDQLGDALGNIGSTGSRVLEAAALIGAVLLFTNLWSRSRGR